MQRDIGVAVSFLALAVALIDAFRLNTPLMPLLAILGAAASYAWGPVIVDVIRKSVDVDPFALNSLAFALAFPVVATLAFFDHEAPVLPATIASAIALTWLVLVSVVGYAVNVSLVKVKNASYVAFASVLAPLVTLGGSMATGLRTPSMGFYIGVLGVSAGLLISGVAKLPDWLGGKKLDELLKRAFPSSHEARS